MSQTGNPNDMAQKAVAKQQKPASQQQAGPQPQHQVQAMAQEQQLAKNSCSLSIITVPPRREPKRPRAAGCCTQLGAGLLNDLKRRTKLYLSDYTDGLFGHCSLYKTISTTVFLYFSVLLPCIAFGVVHTNNTDGQIDPNKTMIGQALGGLFFAIFSGQPLIVIMTTAPLCIYVKVIYQTAQDFEVEFSTFYASVGLFMCFFLILMSITNSSNLMGYCTRSTEEIFALFTAFAFGSDGIKQAFRSFKKNYWEPDCSGQSAIHLPRLPPDASNSMANLTNFLSKNLTNSLLTVAQSMPLPSTSALHQNPNNHNHNTTASSTIITNHHHQQPASLIDPTLTGAGHDLASQELHQQLSNLGNQHHDLSVNSRCQRDTCILFLLLMCGTLWLANCFSSFDKTFYLNASKREIIKDYALAISVLIFSFIGSFLFSDIRLDVFEFNEFAGLQFAQVGQLSFKVMAVSCLLGFMLSVLFYIDQNICGAMVNNSPYKLKKGDYFHLDLLILAILNALLSLTGLPWMHGKLPHSHLHSKALADYEERVNEGYVQHSIVNIRETRLTGILCSLLIGLSLLAVPYPISYIPLPVLSGVFLYTALAEFKSNSMVERICLLFTEKAAYPSDHYSRRCPRRKIHLFTLAQVIQLLLVSCIGFYPNPYVNMTFPLVVAMFVPIRDKLIPYLIDARYLNSLDNPSSLRSCQCPDSPERTSKWCQFRLSSSLKSNPQACPSTYL